MKRPESLPRYRSYLLRLWSVNKKDNTGWRASVEDVRTHERLTFATLQELCVYLLALAGTGEENGDDIE